MDTIRSKHGPGNSTPGQTSVWRDDGSTVGFARLQDEEGVLSSLDMQRSVYGNIGTAVTSTAEEGEKKPATGAPLGIMKEIKVDQRSDVIV